jgi:hypothetical protein
METMTQTANKQDTRQRSQQNGEPNQNQNTQETQHLKEGQTTRAIEQQTAKVPSDAFLAVAVGAMSVSLGLMIAKQRHTALFIGQWVAPFLLFGIYNKLVKQLGHQGEKAAMQQ